MVISENETKEILLFAIEPYLNKYDLKINELDLNISHNICIRSLIEFSNKTFCINVHFCLDYQNENIVFKDIDGTVKYGPIELPFMQVLKQFVRVPLLKIKDTECQYPIKLPVKYITLETNTLKIQI